MTKSDALAIASQAHANHAQEMDVYVKLVGMFGANDETARSTYSLAIRHLETARHHEWLARIHYKTRAKYLRSLIKH